MWIHLFYSTKTTTFFLFLFLVVFLFHEFQFAFRLLKHTGTAQTTQHKRPQEKLDKPDKTKEGSSDKTVQSSPLHPFLSPSSLCSCS